MIKIEISKNLEISPYTKLPKTLLVELKQSFIVQNPKHVSNTKYGYSNYGVPAKLYFIHKQKPTKTIILPRGAIQIVLDIFNKHKIKHSIVDNTVLKKPIKFEFTGKLKPSQIEPVEAILSTNCGILSRPTGGGKTVIALKTIAERKQPTLIVVHTTELLQQWKERAKSFLNLNENEIGMLGGGYKKIEGKIIIAIINSLYKNIDAIKNKVGYVIVDEGHKIPARTFSEALASFNCRYILSLSATPYRQDGLTEVIKFYSGNILHHAEITDLQEDKSIMVPKLEAIKTNYNYYTPKGSFQYQTMMKNLIKNKERNELIVTTYTKSRTKNTSWTALIISDYVEHCKTLYDLFSQEGGNIKVGLLTGGTNKKSRTETKNRLLNNKLDLVIATSRIIGEGFDYDRLSSIYLATPVRFHGRLIQYIGRILRLAKDKEPPKIYDFEDPHWVLKSSFKKRIETYREKLGITITET